MQPTLNSKTIEGINNLMIQVNYPKDTWTFYLSKEGCSRKAYQFIKHYQTGKLVELENLIHLGEVTIPKNRQWFTLPKQKHIVTDILVIKKKF